MKYILTEQQYNFLIKEIAFDPEVAKIQRVLIKKYDLGKYGPNKDGVDGKLGPLTKKAMEKEYGKSMEQSILKNRPTGFFDAVLIGGLDYRNGDLSIDQQVQKLSTSLGMQNVKGFRYNAQTSDILSFLKDNPNIPVYMFSAGCVKAKDISSSQYVNKSKIYIVEPYAKSERTKQIVQSAVSNGVPSKNVFAGPNKSRGDDVVNGASFSNARTHWDALGRVGLITKS